MSSKAPADAFKKMMESATARAHERAVQASGAKRKTSDESGDSKKSHHSSGSGFWKRGLIQASSDPKNVIDSTPHLVVIRDKYPKAKFHYLILPTTVELNSPKELKKDHLPVLEEMDSKAQELTNRLHPNISFKVGFHARPSMDSLHLHVISQDFVSPCLKTKRHWNSFNTPHFLTLEDIISQLKEKGEILDFPTESQIDSMLKLGLLCNQCSFEAKTMPQLKTHLESHLLT